jgi:hypothetical protein
MLSTLPKLADKAFIIGFLLPMIAFFISLFYLFSDVPQIAFVLKALAEKESFEKTCVCRVGQLVRGHRPYDVE